MDFSKSNLTVAMVIFVLAQILQFSPNVSANANNRNDSQKNFPEFEDIRVIVEDSTIKNDGMEVYNETTTTTIPEDQIEYDYVDYSDGNLPISTIDIVNPPSGLETSQNPEKNFFSTILENHKKNTEDELSPYLPFKYSTNFPEIFRQRFEENFNRFVPVSQKTVVIRQSQPTTFISQELRSNFRGSRPNRQSFIYDNEFYKLTTKDGEFLKNTTLVSIAVQIVKLIGELKKQLTSILKYYVEDSKGDNALEICKLGRLRLTTSSATDTLSSSFGQFVKVDSSDGREESRLYSYGAFRTLEETIKDMRREITNSNYIDINLPVETLKKIDNLITEAILQITYQIKTDDDSVTQVSTTEITD